MSLIPCRPCMKAMLSMKTILEIHLHSCKNIVYELDLISCSVRVDVSGFVMPCFEKVYLDVTVLQPI